MDHQVPGRKSRDLLPNAVFLLLVAIDDKAPGPMDAIAQAMSPLTLSMFLRSTSLCGFFLPNFFTPKHLALSQAHMDRLSKLVLDGKLDVPVDDKNGALNGVAAVPDAVEHLHTGLSVGKVVVKL